MNKQKTNLKKVTPSTQQNKSKHVSFRAPSTPKKVGGGESVSGQEQKYRSHTDRKRQQAGSVKSDKTVMIKKTKGRLDNQLYVSVTQSERDLFDTSQLCSRLICDCEKLHTQAQSNLNAAGKLAKELLGTNCKVEIVEENIHSIESTGIYSMIPLGIEIADATIVRGRHVLTLLDEFVPPLDTLKKALSVMDSDELRKVGDQLIDLEKKLLALGEEDIRSEML